MKYLILVAALGLALPAVAQPRNHGNMATGRHEGVRHGERHFQHRHFTGFRGNRGHFRGWRGGIIGEIIILDDGCYVWNGIEWVATLDCYDY